MAISDVRQNSAVSSDLYARGVMSAISRVLCLRRQECCGDSDVTYSFRVSALLTSIDYNQIDRPENANVCSFVDQCLIDFGMVSLDLPWS